MEGKLFTSLYQQRAAEYKALCLQAFNIATLQLNANTLTAPGLPKAIVTDIDETILDNSPYAVHRALMGKEYDSASWHEWSLRMEADTVPGAPAFLNYAASKGVEIFYITNRFEVDRESTMKNLKKFNFPNVDEAHMLMRTTTSEKGQRRQMVASKFDVIMLLGDNLADFSDLFDKKTMEERNANVDNSAAAFGKRFIVLPNPDYGDWEGALLKYNRKLTLPQKDSVYRSWLKGY